MAKITQVRVFMQKTVQITRFQPMVVGVERTAQLDDIDNAAEIIAVLQDKCMADIKRGMELDSGDW